MKKSLAILMGLIIAVPAFADDPEPTPTYPNDTVVSASYVKGAYDAVMGDVGDKADLGTTAKTTIVAAVNEINTAVGGKQATLESTGNDANVSVSGTGPVVTGVSASSGAVTVSKGEIQVPVGSMSNSTLTVTSHAQIWIN